MERGFSTLELLLAMALFCIILGGAAAALYGNQYWSLSLAVLSDGLSHAEKSMMHVERIARDDFYSASSTPPQSSCEENSSCYEASVHIVDISPCAKFATTESALDAESYPTVATFLARVIVDTQRLVALGGDCGLISAADWEKHAIDTREKALSAEPLGIDVLNGRAFVIEKNPSQIEIIHGEHVSRYSPDQSITFSAIDVARDIGSGRTLAFIAASPTPMYIMDFSETSDSRIVASTTLEGVAKGDAEGWRLQYYDRHVYITTRFISNPSAAEFHVLNVNDPTRPQEVGSYKLSTSPYAILVRDQYREGVKKRYAYLATTHISKELVVLDVTNPGDIRLAQSCNLPNNQQGTSLYLLGNTLYFGRENVPSGGEDLYVFDAEDPTSSEFCTPLYATDINDDRFSRHVQALHASSNYFFVATNNTTNAHGTIQIRWQNENVNLIRNLVLDQLIDNGMDFDGDTNTLYALSGGNSPSLFIATPQK